MQKLQHDKMRMALDAVCDMYDVTYHKDGDEVVVKVHDHSIPITDVEIALQNMMPSGVVLDVEYGVQEETDGGYNEELGGYRIFTLGTAGYEDAKKYDLMDTDIICREIVGGHNQYYYDGKEFYSRNHSTAIDYIEGTTTSTSASNESEEVEEDKDIWSELPTDKRVMWTNKYQEQGYINATITDYVEDGDIVTYHFELPWGDVVEYDMDISTFNSSGNLNRFTEMHGYEEDQYKHLIDEESKMVEQNGRWKPMFKSTGEEFEEEESSASMDLNEFTSDVIIFTCVAMMFTTLGIVSLASAISSLVVLTVLSLIYRTI